MRRSLHPAYAGLNIGYPSWLFRRLPCPPALCDCWLALLRPADEEVYTGKNDWNSLRGPVQAACSHAWSELASQLWSSKAYRKSIQDFGTLAENAPPFRHGRA